HEVVEHDEPQARRGFEEEPALVVAAADAGREIRARAERLDRLGEERLFERAHRDGARGEEALEGSIQRAHALTSSSARTASSNDARSLGDCRRNASIAPCWARARSKTGSRP